MNVRRATLAVICWSLAAAIGASPAWAQARFRFDTTPGRLSKEAVPLDIRLVLDLDPARERFEGHVEIDLKLSKPAAALELHAHELGATRAWLGSGRERRALVVTPDTDAQLWRLTRADGRPLAAGRQRITIDYAGQVQRQGEGLFRADTLVGGQAHPTLATQLEPIHARRVFPAFDEPVFRARYTLTVRAPEGYEVLSNMPRRTRAVAGGIATHRFMTTPPMPSYLFAVAVGRYEVLEGRAAGVPLRIVTAPGKREQGRFALATTQQLMPYFTRYFGTPYTLPRLDQLAVPSTRWGAMEDWGLISYAENLLLVDPATTGPAQQRRVYNLVAHEVAHQWFGNLVTAASWNEIWLNEAFATWMAAKAMDRFNPEWQTLLNSRGWIDETMAQDATDATRAIRSGPVRETAVFDVFDDITYAKGGAVLTMIEQWLGEERFRRGLAAYMRARRLSNATAGDLWFHIGRSAGRDVGAMASSWTDQAGFPLVSVTERCQAGATRVTLTQQRFRLREPRPGDAGQRWQIPVRLARGSQAATVLLVDAKATVTLPGCSAEPVRANAGGRGYYRVAYAPDAHAALRERFPSLPAADRVALLADTLALAQAGERMAWLSLLPRVRDAGRVPLFKQAIEAFDQLDKALAGSAQQAAMRESASALLATELQRLGWDATPGDDPETVALRGRLVRQLAALDDPATLTEAQARLARDESGQQPLHPSLREAVQIAAGVAADRARFDRMLAALAAAGSEQERRVLAASLASGRDAGRAQELLDRMLRGDLPTNTASMMPSLLAQHSPHGDLAYRHVVEHWEGWSRIAGQVGRRWLLPGAAEHANDPARAKSLIDDQARLVGPDGAQLAARAAARIGQLADLKARASGLGP